MSEDKPLVNRVAQSSLITLKLEEFLPKKELAHFDLKDFLFKGFVLKEKDFRAAVAEHDWNQYRGQVLLVYCSTDAIIPVWAYMLVASSAAPHAAEIYQGNEDAYYLQAFQTALNQFDGSDYTDQRVILKGCSDRPVPPAAYVELTRRLRPHVKSLMYGEPCSTVPIYKRKK
ncbi:MAG: DUF2480 family protein [Saprospiraceae bacterium]|nr:DUF2480 family protein [Saprospiraceae bacterium]